MGPVVLLEFMTPPPAAQAPPHSNGYRIHTSQKMILDQ